MVFFMPGYRPLSLQEWEDIQQRLSNGSHPVVYLEHKLDAEDRMEMGDYRRALVDLAVACETFIRTTVLQSLPTELSKDLRDYIDQANISQYLNRFFPQVINQTARQQYNRKQYGKNDMPKELASLFSRRNDLLHSGKADGVDRKLCERLLKMTKDLLALEGRPSYPELPRHLHVPYVPGHIRKLRGGDPQPPL
jgi:hypothetical protein